jgi:D-alanine-D-alanine ligase
MRVGITYDLKDDGPAQPDLPDDFQEEYDSPTTIEAIAAVLRGMGHEITTLGDGRPMLEQLLTDPPNFVFNIAEGQGIGRSREARVPAVLDMLGIPYTGSDPLTLAVTLDKDCAKRLVASAGVAVPQGMLIPRDASLSRIIDEWPLDRFPVIVKPAWEGSSKGIRGKCLVDCRADLPEVVDALRRDHRQPVLVEEYIEGDELTIGVIGNEPPGLVGIMRVLPQQAGTRFIYSLEVKRDWQRLACYEAPARLPPAATKAVEQAALAAYQVLGCRDVARVDFRLRDHTPYFLEINPLPGLNPETGDLIILARKCGWTYERLIGAIFQAGRNRHESTFAASRSRAP